MNQIIYLILFVEVKSLSGGLLDKTVTTSYEYVDNKCCMKTCFGAENNAECQSWKDSIVKANQQQGEITEERVARLEATYQEILELRHQAEQNRTAKIEKLKSQLNATWQVRKAEIKSKLAAEVERVRQACITARETMAAREELEGSDCGVCGTAELCHITYKGVCYWMKTDGIVAQDAAAVCQRNDSQLAVIQDETHYNLAVGLIRDKHDAPSNSSILIGLFYDSSSGDVSLANGTLAPYVDWDPSFPNVRPDYTHVLLNVPTDPAETTFGGMRNLAATDNTDGVLCQV